VRSSSKIEINSAPLPRWTHLSHRRLQTWPSALTQSSNTLLASPLPSWLLNPVISPRFDDLGIFFDTPHGTPNHVLINEYLPGQGIMPHEDGAAYYPLVATVSLGAPIVLDVYEKRQQKSCSDEGFTPGEQLEREAEEQDEHGGKKQEDWVWKQPRFRILQEPRSLLITTKEMYTDFLHGIAERHRDENLNAEAVSNWDLLGEKERYECGSYERQTRVSLTYRDVLKVAKLGNSIKLLNAKG
jgi:alkylated DNA repair protein alkB homolog 6